MKAHQKVIPVFTRVVKENFLMRTILTNLQSVLQITVQEHRSRETCLNHSKNVTKLYDWELNWSCLSYKRLAWSLCDFQSYPLQFSMSVSLHKNWYFGTLDVVQQTEASVLILIAIAGIIKSVPVLKSGPVHLNLYYLILFYLLIRWRQLKNRVKISTQIECTKAWCGPESTQYLHRASLFLRNRQGEER